MYALCACISARCVHHCIYSIPTFHNLTQLVLTSYFDWHYHDCGWQFLVELLNHCPKLQKFDVDQTDTQTDIDEETFNIIADNVPQCLSLHLQTCNLLNLSLQAKLMLARYILKNARVLQTMTISNRGQPEIKGLLSSCPRASATCKLKFQRKRQSRGTW
ncbi:putative FBD domain, leucine-rich repeat domain, L domain-containing protein [Medicago truncatula]|uniref:Putative FBD domain, leucine-rich repeat domain, L domain-containing protein n=1 Tax=Medicago truncatula TaxID=3880 RepID=A0A396GXK7_MEDTR|nr:putative FBD domain, leucine-rich repeat domain, L domain-containing protein [Medicago truncatula]